jgi:hypothetical protein
VKVVIEIDCDNSAFYAGPRTELTRILGDLARIVASPHHVAIVAGEHVKIRDLKGKTLGFVEERGGRSA